MRPPQPLFGHVQPKEGQARTTSLEGVPLLTAFVHSDLT
jgi:hypothetical protein